MNIHCGLCENQTYLNRPSQSVLVDKIFSQNNML